MNLELSKEARTAAVASLRRYFEENLPEPIGELPAGLLLNYILEEIGPVLYNRGVADAQARVTARVSDLSGELWEEEFGYWPKADAKRRGRR